jgi:hypothetical protein
MLLAMLIVTGCRCPDLTQEPPVTAERDRTVRREIVLTDPVRDSEAEKTRAERVALANPIADKPLKRSRLTDKLVLAHLFATGFPQPQPREKRRADPTDGKASRRTGGKRAAKRRGSDSRKA